MKIFNEVLNKWYDPDECLFFENAAQSAAYMFRGGAELQALLESTNHLGRFIFVFKKEDHKRLRKLWKEHKL